MNEITIRPANPLAPKDMSDAIRLAEMMTRGKMVPGHLQNSAADCLMVIEQAMRWGMSPFAVAQCTSSIKGKLMFEGKLVAAAVETSGAIAGNFDYQFSGSGADRKITVSARRVGDAEPKTVEVLLRDARTDNPLWNKQPDQQLVYHGVRVWARRWTPAVILGVYSREEMAEEAEAFAGPTIEADPTQVTFAEPPTLDDAKTPREFLDALEIAFGGAETKDAVDAIIAHPRVQKAMDAFQNGARERLNKLVADAMARTAPPATMDDEAPF